MLAPHLDRFTKAHKNLRQPLLPENVFGHERHEERTLNARRQVAESRLKTDGALAHVGEAALWSDNKEMLR